MYYFSNNLPVNSSLKPQVDLVLDHLMQHKNITKAEAYELYGVINLATIIHRLRHQGGFDISTRFVESVPQNGYRGAVYSYNEDTQFWDWYNKKVTFF